VFSNGGGSYFPSNTLTNFTNKFPAPLHLDKRYEIGIESIGFSSHFKNVITPPAGIPSLIVTNCNNSHKFYERQGFQNHPNQTEGPIRWTFKENTEQTCISVEDIDDDGATQKCFVQDCFIHVFTLKDKEYTERDISNFCLHVANRTHLAVDYQNKQITFKISQRWIDKFGYKRCYVMMHDSFSKTFGFDKRFVSSYTAESKTQGFSDTLKQAIVGYGIGKAATIRSTTYKGHKFDVFYVDHIPPDDYTHEGTRYIKEFGQYIFLTSNFIDISKPAFPKTIKVVCDNIEAQIYNSEYSKNMLVYTPDFKKLKRYTTQEIVSVDYMPLSNTLLTEMRFKLLDENNEQIQLLPGAATWLKLSLRSMPFEKKSLNAVLTSERSTFYPNNVQSMFRVRLPSPLDLGSEWKVCVSSLSHPSTYSTFLSHEGEEEKEKYLWDRSLSFVSEPNNEEITLKFKENHTYSSEELISELNNFLTRNNIGVASVTNGILKINFSKSGTAIFGESLARVLGSRGTLAQLNVGQNVLSITENTHTFENKIDLDYYHPKYIMVYASIIRPILVAGEYRKLLRISPVEKQEVAYITNYFRHKEFTRLENSTIDTIEIILAAHDGRRICFSSPQDVTVNLEFSNHADD